MKNLNAFVLAAAGVLSALAPISASAQAGEGKMPPGVKKLGDRVIYEDGKFYCSFPSVVRRPDGELLVAFRRAPDRRPLGEPGVSHTDSNSQLMMVRSRDGGKTWSNPPKLIYAHPYGGSQDPCMVQLSDGTILCTSYAWSMFRSEALLSKPDISRLGNYVFMGGFIVRSEDGGHSWDEPIIPPAVPGQKVLDAFGKPIAAYNRGAICEGAKGRLYWVVASSEGRKSGLTTTHLMISDDKGKTWNYSCPAASDSNVSFDETSAYETPGGDIIAFMRTEKFDDHIAIARSTDGGKSFAQWEDTGVQGHPCHALRLADKRVLLVYGYRHKPYGIRARILDAECTNIKTAPEIILRDDGGTPDLGYPWSVALTDHTVLVVYYFNQKDGARHIDGTILQID